MTKTQEKRKVVLTANEKPRLNYPNNSLRPQVRLFEESFSAFEVVRDTFFADKK